MRVCVLAVAVAISLTGCLGGEGSDTGGRATASCAEPSAQADGEPAVVALLGEVPTDGSELRGPVNRLLRISLPGGEVERERGLGPRWKPEDAERVTALRLIGDSGPQLAVAPDGRTVLALVWHPGSARSAVAVLDAGTLRTLCTHRLEPGVRYGSLLVGRSGTIYAIGVRRAGRSRWDSVLTMADAETGELAASQTLREADQTPRVSSGKGWWAYSAALSDDERRLLVSWHGGDTTGADSFPVSPGSGVERDRRTGAVTDVGWAHGGVAAARGGGFLATTGGHDVLRVGRRGGETGRLHLKGHLGHLMDFELDAARRFLYVSACGAEPGILRADLAGPGRRTVPSGDFCGFPLALHGNRFLVLDATRVSRFGYASTKEPGLRLLDLERAGAGRPIPRSAGAIDAVVVGTKR